MPDLLSIHDLKKSDVERYLSEAKKMEAALAKGKPLRTLEGKIIANLFFEPSTRTNFSFQSAAARLGATPIAFYPEKSSAQKGESFSDTIRILDGYADALVIRHPSEGSAEEAARIATHPVINAGDGGNQHPTQTLIDLYTIKKLFGKISGLNVTLMGDLKHARAMRSLLYGLAMFGCGAELVSPVSLRMDPLAIARAKRDFGVKITETAKPNLSKCNVLYLCRVQKERFSNAKEAQAVQASFRLDKTLLLSANKKMAVLHPLPKLDEIPASVESDSRMKYFEQAKNGVPVRMAVLKLCLGL
ncbi:MAG: aspartate carbamoyltransferase [Candidatus Micrarchaeota archaeon]|nr:aspartate carbamoyltransferase [Candidatus Micrarchaeota archaeon]